MKRGGTMPGNRFHVAKIPIPPELTSAEAEQFIAGLAEALAAADNSLNVKTHSNYVKQDPQDANPVAPTDTMQPLYFCHGKF
jgi:hypothetical protein